MVQGTDLTPFLTNNLNIGDIKIVATNKITKLSKHCKDITSQRFGRLIAIEPTDKRSWGGVIWHCVCDCGNECFVNLGNLRGGSTRSCGCLGKECARRTGKTHISHGLSQESIYKAWHGMIQRCENPNNKAYKNYGGRGIAVCERWHKFENFYKDMGECPGGLTLERINNDGNYELKNCKWATYEEQNNNRRPNSCGPHKQYWFRAWHKNMMCQFLSNNQHKFARKHELDQRFISACLHNKQKTHKGWEFCRA